MSDTIDQFSAAASGDPAAQPRSGWLAAGGIVGAIGASTCCVLPLVLTVLGVSGAWMANLRAMEAYKGYFITLAVVALAVGFYQVYFKPRRSCAAGAACARPLPNRMVKAGLWFGLLVITLVLAFPYIFPIIEPYLP